MFDWLAANIGSVIVGLAVLCIVAAVLFKIVRDLLQLRRRLRFLRLLGDLPRLPHREMTSHPLLPPYREGGKLIASRPQLFKLGSVQSAAVDSAATDVLELLIGI